MSDQEDPVEMDVGPDEERHAKESVKEKAVTPEEVSQDRCDALSSPTCRTETEVCVRAFSGR